MESNRLVWMARLAKLGGGRCLESHPKSVQVEAGGSHDSLQALSLGGVHCQTRAYGWI